MKLPAAEDLSQIQKLRYEALAALRAPHKNDVEKKVMRAQYEGYGETVGNPKSNTETFVSLTLYSEEYRWNNVPIILTAGKALDRQVTEIKIHYKKQAAQETNFLPPPLHPS